MKTRTESILGASLQSFIKMGKPVTSGYLYEHYDFGIKPAMIRWELTALTELGFMTQIHSSGGRMPTNKAYRFLVDALLEREETEDQFLKGAKSLLRGFWGGDMRPFIQTMADYLEIASFGYRPAEDLMCESGLHRLLSRLEAEEKDELVEVVEDAELLEDRLQDFKIQDKGPQVFIGEGPLVRSDRVSLIVEQFDVRDSRVFLAAIGPKRMDYRKPLRFFRSLKKAAGAKK